MGKTKFTLFFFALALFTLPAFAWNCTGNDIRVQVPTGTVGTGTGDAPGNVVVDNGLTFQCQTPPSTALPSASTTSNSNAASSANSGSTSSANAAGSNAASSATGGKATSTSGVSTSGNSTNNLTNTNNLALSNKSSNKQSQVQSNSSTNNNQSAGGSVSDVGNSETTVEAPKIPVSTAEAPPVFSTVNCFKGFSAGGQTAVAGLSFGGGGIDKNCAAERIAQDYYAMGNRLAACKVIITTKASKAAGVTLADCLNVPIPAPRVLVQPAPAAAPAPVSVTVNMLPAQVLPVFHEYVTVTATPAQVHAARSAHKPAAPVHKAQHKPCPATPLQNDCPVKTAEK